MTVAASSTPLAPTTRETCVADLEEAFGQSSPLHQHVSHLVPTRGALDRLRTRAQRLVSR